MRPEEISSMLLYKACKPNEIKFFRKVIIGQTFLTSDDDKRPDRVTISIPQEARFFFGIRRINNNKVTRNVELILNDEKILDQCSNALLRGTIAANTSIESEYIELSRKLTGSDSMFYNINYGFASLEEIMIWIAIDTRLLPKEGVPRK